MADPVIALISSYKEGSLIQGTIRSIFDVPSIEVLVYDGTTRGKEIPGEETDLGVWKNYVTFHKGSWYSEHQKRNAMLKRARLMYPDPFWIMTIDADEILVWGEYLIDWLNVLKPGYPDSQENAVPIKRTEASWTPTGFLSDIAPSRLIHSSMVKEYLISCLKIKTPDDNVFFATHRQAERMPMYGEPHIHHRSYLRRNQRADVRESTEEKKLLEEQGIPTRPNGISQTWEIPLDNSEGT